MDREKIRKHAEKVARRAVNDDEVGNASKDPMVLISMIIEDMEEVRERLKALEDNR